MEWYLTQTPLQFTQLPSGTYRLCADIHSNASGIDEGFECYDNILPESEVQLPANATDIVVQAGNATNITIAFGNFTQLEGIVRTPDGTPLGGVNVSARTITQNARYSTVTDANGYFRFAYLRNGTYALVVNDSIYDDNNYLPSIYPGVHSWNEATLLEITPDKHYDLTMTLTPQARIIGKITLPNGAPVEYPFILLYSQDPDGTWRPSSSCQDAACPFYRPISTWASETDLYVATYFPAGRYRIQASQYFGGANLTGFYGGATLEEADDIVIAAGQTIENIDIALEEQGYDSAITGVVTANDVSQPNIEVGLFLPYFSSDPEMPIVTTSTDTEGRYLFEGLSRGTYRIAARDPAGIYATRFYTNDIPDFLASQWINVPLTSTTVAGINIALSLGGTISGQVHVEPENSPVDYKIQVIENDTLYFYTQPFNDVRTDQEGFYRFTGLPPGKYFVSAQSPEIDPFFGSQPVRFYPATSDQSTAVWIQVDAGDERTAIDISFIRPPTSYLPSVGVHRESE